MVVFDVQSLAMSHLLVADCDCRIFSLAFVGLGPVFCF
jgi:hypothetical protein